VKGHATENLASKEIGIDVECSPKSFDVVRWQTLDNEQAAATVVRVGYILLDLSGGAESFCCRNIISKLDHSSGAFF
jgi:hypothetical protein